MKELGKDGVVKTTGVGAGLGNRPSKVPQDTGPVGPKGKKMDLGGGPTSVKKGGK